jgi:hypothetical protein
VPFPQEKELQGIRDTFQIFFAGVGYRKMILIYFSPALLLELLGSTHPGTLEWIYRSKFSKFSYYCVTASSFRSSSCQYSKYLYLPLVSLENEK